MKKIYLLSLLLFLFGFKTSAQLFFNDDFDYNSNTTLVNNGWVQILNTTTAPISVYQNKLFYQGYAGSGIGNSTLLMSSGQDVYKESSAISNSKAVYLSFLMNDSIAQTGGNYFISLASSTSTTAIARVFIKLSSAGYYKIGVSKSTDVPVYSTDSFAIENTYLCVLKYQFNTLTTRDDSIKLYAFSNGMPTAEPLNATVETIGGTSTDATTISKIVLTQLDAITSPTVFVDGIRMANAWEKLNGSNLVNPYPVKNATAVAAGANAMNLSWTNPYNFDSLTMKTLVFVKPTNAIVQGTPSYSSNYYVANNNLKLASSHYQNDSLAFCVFKGTANTTTLTGLNPASTYTFLFEVVSNTDSIYSRAATATAATLSLPSAATLPTFTASGSSSAKIAWTRPGTYNRNTMTTLVFVKSGAAINNQTPTIGASNFVADTNFLSTNASALPSDLDAKCVFVGDTNFVNIGSLQAGNTYYYLIYIVRDTDSAYSLPTLANAGLQTAVTSASAVVFSALSSSSAKISWTKPASYVNSNMSSLVFVKALNPINTAAIPSTNASTYSNDTAFLNGTKFQLDSAAYCVYKGDSNFVTVSNLATGTLYYVVVYMLRDSDNLYSVPALGSGSSRQGPPLNVSNLSFTGLGQITGKATWTKQTGYVNATHTTLVFLKQGAAINSNTPTKTVTAYTASANFLSAISSKYQHDTLAKCIYKGDTNFVNISSLTANSTYFLMVYVVRDADSTYSLSTIASGYTLGTPALRKIGDLNTSNQSSADADSIGVRATFRGIVYGFNQRRVNQGGLQFLLKDATGGINVLHTTKSFGYTVQEGDSVEVQGTIASTMGLVSISNIDTLIRIDSNKSIENPILVNQLNEQTENKLIRIDNVQFLVSPVGGVWPAARNNTIVYLTKNNGIDTISVRLASTNTLSGAPLPTTRYFSIVGIGSQASSSFSAPYAMNGYQILPRYAADIIEIPDTIAAFTLNSLPNADTLYLAGNPANTVQFNWNVSKSINNTIHPVYTFNVHSANFSSILFSTNSAQAGIDTLVEVNTKLLADAIGKTGDTVQLNWQVQAQAGNFIVYSDTFQLTAIIGNFNVTGMNNSMAGINMHLYPNPAKELIQIACNEGIQHLEFYDLTGKLIQHISGNDKPQQVLNIPEFERGIYLLKITTEHAHSIQKIILE